MAVEYTQKYVYYILINVTCFKYFGGLYTYELISQVYYKYQIYSKYVLDPSKNLTLEYKNIKLKQIFSLLTTPSRTTFFFDKLF